MAKWKEEWRLTINWKDGQDSVSYHPSESAAQRNLMLEINDPDNGPWIESHEIKKTRG